LPLKRGRAAGLPKNDRESLDKAVDQLHGWMMAPDATQRAAR
jgi:hypothetical protein